MCLLKNKQNRKYKKVGKITQSYHLITPLFINTLEYIYLEDLSRRIFINFIYM